MNIKIDFNIDKETYIDIFRGHLKKKVRIRRSLYLSVILYVFVMLMKYGAGRTFGIVDTLTSILVIITMLVSLITEFYLPKKAYESFVNQERFQGTLRINDTGVSVTHGILESTTEWDKFDSYIELECYFLLYRGGYFLIVPKQFSKDELSSLREALKKI